MVKPNLPSITKKVVFNKHELHASLPYVRWPKDLGAFYHIYHDHGTQRQGEEPNQTTSMVVSLHIQRCYIQMASIQASKISLRYVLPPVGQHCL